MSFLNQIKDQIDGIVKTFTGGSTNYAVNRGSFPSAESVLNIVPEKWNQKYDYSFQVEDDRRIGALRKFRDEFNKYRDSGGIFSEKSTGLLTGFLMSNSSAGAALRLKNKQTEKTDREAFSELILQINPSDLQQDENFAVNITPTQDGIVAEHNGIVFKDLTLSGTTGIHPLRGVSGATKKGAVVSSGKAKSGYEHFLEIRNYFRAYAEAKRSTKNNTLVLLFKNRKDGETLIVEPIKFSLKRNASKPFMYDYTIVMKVLKSIDPIADKEGPFSWLKKIEEVSDLVKEKLDIARGILLTSQNILRNIESEINTVFFEPFRKFSMVLNDTVGLAQSLGDMPGNIKNNFDKSVIQAFNDTLSVLPRIGGAMGLVPDIQKNKSMSSASGMSPTELKSQTSVLADDIAMTQMNTEDTLTPELQAEFDEEIATARKLTRTFYEDLLNTTNELRDSAAEKFNLNTEEYNTYSGRVDTFEVESFKQATNEEMLVLYGLDQAAAALELFLVSDALGDDDTEKIDTIDDKFGGKIDIGTPSSALEVIIEYGQTLEGLSSQYLGTPERWIDISVLNNLKPPYIQEVGSTDGRVKAWGDTILIPSTQDSFSDGIIDNKETKVNSELKEVDKQMGIDIKLTENYDFSFNNTGDVNLISGAENAGQAIIIKLTLEKGDLRYHPELGLGVEVGEKLKDPYELKEEIIRTMEQDPRFESISNVNFRVEGNVVKIDMSIKLKSSTIPIPITI